MATEKHKFKHISKTKIDRHLVKKDNSELKSLILKLKKKKEKEQIRLAYLLARPRRKVPAVNLFKINKFSKENDIIIVPGKVLSNGNMEHKITLSAFSLSEQAKTKLKEAKCEIKPLLETAEKGKFKIII